MLEIMTYVLYLAISLTVTLWVGSTLHRNGRIFLLDAFGGNGQMADSVNQLLRVGFYLLNIGFIALFLNTGTVPETAGGMVRMLSWQIGAVLLVLGGVHFFNMRNIAGMRSKAMRKQEEPGLNTPSNAGNRYGGSLQ
ncbi:hypothetical protein [Deinococcus sp.]|uniref:hypothetical protein n=1 Tax=Deinococcus sp. TaxID=47478 RepID=UPI003B5B6A9E